MTTDKINELAEVRTPKAIKQCADWLKFCLQLGWDKSSLDELEKIWWEHHDNNGNLIKTAAKEGVGMKYDGEIKSKIEERSRLLFASNHEWTEGVQQAFTLGAEYALSLIESPSPSGQVGINFTGLIDWCKEQQKQVKIAGEEIGVNSDAIIQHYNLMIKKCEEMKAHHLPDALKLAELFHNTYERLAPQFGYATREDTKVFDKESPNGKLMIAVCKEIKSEFNSAQIPVREEKMDWDAIMIDELDCVHETMRGNDFDIGFKAGFLARHSRPEFK